MGIYIRYVPVRNEALMIMCFAATEAALEGGAEFASGSNSVSKKEFHI